ncbi:uncharacterized protein K460DRAFT_350872 [Cucurbitaria berberidis CBS 394.84]|uniref:Uncharacterized protein n=1 Tax=Cucurbitaria berberidis CBS 394.84 TaxID=1168544 RepID=A0A9P4GT72_9PLEO|nr:uncharacterized protein K460DRAFT_350872 [Cucurbitaria berberidis CBS 394.84]KAF1850872.1 hypothetical protein K460DRAFT_350872 [Cucurbitaria berberidis CBS 394.84]
MGFRRLFCCFGTIEYESPYRREYPRADTPEKPVYERPSPPAYSVETPIRQVFRVEDVRPPPATTRVPSSSSLALQKVNTTITTTSASPPSPPTRAYTPPVPQRVLSTTKPSPPKHPSTSALTPAPAPAFPLTTWSTTTTAAVAEAPRTEECPLCSAPNLLRTVQYKSQSINTGRPWRCCSNKACERSNGFNGFADARGLVNSDGGKNRFCKCAAPVRLVAKNEVDAMGRRQAFYSCQFKACSAWFWHEDWEGERTVFSRGEIEGMVRRGEI